MIVVSLAVLPIGLAVSLDGSTYDTWGAFVWGPVLMALAFPLCRWVAQRTGEPHLAGFLFGAAALKILIGGITRYYMVDAVYGAGDANRYDGAAALLAEPFRRGVFADLGEITGSRFIDVLTGVVQAVIGQTMVGSFLVFSAFGFLGMCFLYLAFCEALPDGDRVLYRRLLFLTPTLWFWPSSIGKEAFLLMSVGAVAYGFTRLVTGHLTGMVVGGLGLWGVVVVRPHIGMMLLAGLLAGSLPVVAARRRSADRVQPRVRWGRFLLPMLLVAATPVVLGAAEEFFDIEELNLESATEVREEVAGNTAQGGSQFAPPDTNTVPGFIVGVVTVVARPLPWEITSAQMAITAGELAVLGGVYIVAVKRRGRALLAAWRERWVRFSLACVLSFGWGFSVVANYGILARQRSLMLPFVFVLVAAVRRPAARDVSGIAGSPVAA